jgi:hypothetical protein
MSQQFHTKRDNQIHQIVEWLEDLLTQKKDGVPVHHIQQFQVMNCFQTNISIGYMAIVLCQHEAIEFAQDKAMIENLLDIHSN